MKPRNVFPLVYPDTSMRKMIATTLRQDLWQELRMDALRRGLHANDILEKLIFECLEAGKEGRKTPGP